MHGAEAGRGRRGGGLASQGLVAAEPGAAMDANNAARADLSVCAGARQYFERELAGRRGAGGAAERGGGHDG